MKRIYTSNNPTILRIHPTLASQIGLNESIMLLQLEFLISISTSEKHDGRDWTFQSVRDLQENYFPFWSHMTVNRVIKSLEEKGYITIDNFNKYKYDKTRWITINYENLEDFDSIVIKDTPVSKRNTLSQNVTRSDQNVTTIPETTTEITTELKKKEKPLKAELTIEDKEQLEIEFMEYFSKITKIPQPYKPAALANWIQQVGDWVDMRVTKGEIDKAVSVADEEGMSIVRPGSLTSFLIDMRAKNARGVSNNGGVPKHSPDARFPGSDGKIYNAKGETIEPA